MKISNLAFLLLLGLWGCTTPGPPPQRSFSLHKIPVLEAVPASQISGPDHLAGVNPNGGSSSGLVVFLSGTGGSPSSSSLFLQEVLGLGFHVISLAYPNQQSLGGLFQNDLESYGPLRNEICFGEDTSEAGPQVGPADSLVSRLSGVLTVLAARAPGEGWDSYLGDGEPVWENIILAGYSQGSGHAAYLAQKRPLRGVVMLSGVVDGRVADPRQSADWVTQPQWETPRDRFRFFIHTADGNAPAIETNLVTLGFPASTWVNTDQGGDLGSGPVFTTSLPLGDLAHGSTCDDGATPRDGKGLPVYAPVWRALFNGL